MPIAILMPALSPTMTEGTLAKWLKNEGEKISAGDIIAEVETDKATMEVESIEEGILAKQIVSNGTENIPVNSLIAVILSGNEKDDSIQSFVENHPSNKELNIQETSENIIKEDNETLIIEEHESNKKLSNNFVSRILDKEKQEEDTKKNQTETSINLKTDIKKSSPLARRLCEQAGININEIKGSGPHGRVVKDDVESFIDSKRHKNFDLSSNKADSQVIKPTSNMRKIIAKKLTESKQNTPHFYLVSDISVDALVSARKEINDTVSSSNSQIEKISLNDMIIKALALALKSVPKANCSWAEESIIYSNAIDISVAVAVGEGLFTPVIKNADNIGIAEIAFRMKAFIDKAKSGKLLPEEYKGGTFSISNLGMYGVDSFSGIINPPQSGILAVGQASDRVVVKNGEMCVNKIMTCTFSLDHRVIDGALGAKLLSSFKSFIEYPSSMLL